MTIQCRKKGKIQVKSVFLLLFAVVALSAVFVLLRMPGQKGSDTSGIAAQTSSAVSDDASSSADSQKPAALNNLNNLNNQKITDVAAMTVTNSKGGYTIRPVKQGQEEYYVEELKDLPVTSSLITLVLQNSFDVVPAEVIGEAENLGDFGLADPAATVTVHFQDGSDFVYDLGDSVPLEDETRYLCVKGSNEVYTVNFDSRLLEDCTTFADSNVISLEKTGNDATGFSKIELSGSNFKKNMMLVQNTAQIGNTTHHMTQPVSTDCDNNAVSALTAYLTHLPSQAAAAAHPTAEQLAQYGMVNPYATIAYSYKGTAYRLSASPKDKSTYYVMREGVDMIYEVSADYVKYWAETSTFTLRSKKVIQLSMPEIHSMSLQTQNSDYTLTIERTRDEFKSTEKKPAYTYQITADGGKSLSVQNYQNFLSILTGIAITADAPEEMQNQPASLSVLCKNDSGATVADIQLVPYGERQTVLVIDHQGVGIISQSDAKMLVSTVDYLIGLV